MKKQFDTQFAAIREEFRKVFRELFGGGEADLGLVYVQDEEGTPGDELEAGISIMAQPPGKKLQSIMQLSGGEKAKVALSRLLLMDLNLLILDEPTNHLDLYTLEALEELLSGYGGTILFVSHDETFVQKVSNRMVRFEDRKLVTWEGGLTEQQKSKERDTAQEDRKLAMMRLEMRMADLSARMAKPRKGDRPEELNEEYMRLAEEIRKMRG
jgi:energy-coupling factor transporter ATP-binding protein EcfA2